MYIHNMLVLRRSRKHSGFSTYNWILLRKNQCHQWNFLGEGREKSLFHWLGRYQPPLDLTTYSRIQSDSLTRSNIVNCSFNRSNLVAIHLSSEKLVFKLWSSLR